MDACAIYSAIPYKQTAQHSKALQNFVCHSINICRLFIWDLFLFLYFTIIKMTKKMAMYNVLWHVNQFDVRIDNKNYFYSYNSLCVIIDWDSSTIIFGRDWDYSRTTLKHLYAFMDDNYLSTLDNKKTIQKAIEDWQIGDYRVYYDNEMH